MRLKVKAEVTGGPVREEGSGGLVVTRFVVSLPASGPLATPARLPVMTSGAEAERCARLEVGYFVEFVADLRERIETKDGVEYPERCGVLVSRLVRKAAPVSKGAGK